MMMSEPLTVSETYILLEKSVEQLGHAANRFTNPTPGNTSYLDEVIERCDGIIDLCVLIIQKAQIFDDIRNGRNVNGVI